MFEIRSVIPEKFGEDIYYYKSILGDSKGIVEKINEEHSSDGMQCIGSWYEWKSSDGDYVFGKKKDTNAGWFGKSSEHNQDIYSALNGSMVFAAKEYASEKGIELGRMSEISVNVYDPEKHMGPHADIADNGQISVVLYLNDNYDGGELEFPGHDAIIKPSAGSIVVFPSTAEFIHDPKPATDYRYVCTAFWYAS